MRDGSGLVGATPFAYHAAGPIGKAGPRAHRLDGAASA
jgi:hypothetical protein